MADPGADFLNGYFRTMDMRQRMMEQQVQQKQFQQTLALHQQNQALESQRFKAQQDQWTEALKDKASLRAEQQQKEQLAEKMDLAKGIASGQFRLAPAQTNPMDVPQMQPGSKPGQIVTDQTQSMQAAPSFQLGGANVRLASPEELSQDKTNQKRAEAAQNADFGASQYQNYLDHNKRLGLPEPDKDVKSQIFAYFGAGGGAPGTEMAKILGETAAAARKGKQGADLNKMSPGEAYTFALQHSDALHQDIYSKLKSNPEAMNDPAFADSVRNVLGADMKRLTQFQQAAASVAPAAAATRNAKDDADFNQLAQAMGSSSLYANPKDFSDKLTTAVRNGGYSRKAVEDYVNVQSRADKRIPFNITEQIFNGGFGGGGGPQTAPPLIDPRQ